jgi:hypothetical protein
MAASVESHVKYMEERERKKELEALAFKTINGLKRGVELAGCCLESSLWGACVRFEGNFTAAECIDQSEIRYATPLMTRSYAVISIRVTSLTRSNCRSALVFAISERSISN